MTLNEYMFIKHLCHLANQTHKTDPLILNSKQYVLYCV